MNKKMRELQARILELTDIVKGYMAEGEGRDLEKAEATLDKIDELQKEYDLEARISERGKAEVPAEEVAKDTKTDGFRVMAKMLNRQRLDDREKTALVSGTDAASGENYLVPDDVRAEIHELRKSYISAKDLISVVPTDSLTGKINYESGTPAGLTAFDDGDAIAEETAVSFAQKSFTIGHYGKLIPVSRILVGAEKAGLMSYLDRWFVKNAVLTENAQIFSTLKSGYNSGTPKALAGWSAFKKSINKDLDPSCLLDGVIVTNQSGFACLDEEVDGNGRPILEANPANPTQKIFQGLTIHVFPDAQLANIDGTHFPVLYGSLKAGANFMDYSRLEFAVSEHAEFKKNQNLLRVIEGFDVMSTDTSAYIYGSLTATA